MATYNPRAGMPPRKKTEVPLGEALPDDLAKAFFEPDTLAQLASPEGLDGNALRGWLLGYMDSIGDQLPDLAQWRRIREEVGRSVVVKEAVKEQPKPAPKTTMTEVGPVVSGQHTNDLSRYYDEIFARERRQQHAQNLYDQFFGKPSPSPFGQAVKITHDENGDFKFEKVNLCGND